MAAVVRIKNNRFVKVNLQNKDARCCSFGEIDKPGVLDGYIKAVVHTAYPVFQNNFYGKLRKLILVETKDDDDEEEDEDEYLKFPIFTRGIVAEKCKEVKEGDFLLLEKPFLELSQPQKAKFHIIGDKKCSDICIWIVNKKSTRLLVGKEEENGYDESNSESEEWAADSENVENDMRNQKDDHGETASSLNQATCSNVKRVTRNKKEVAKPRKSPISTRRESSSENDISTSKTRVTRSRAARNALDQRVTRITSSGENDVILEESSQKSQMSSSEIERPNTRYSLRKTTDKNNVSPPPTKRRRRFRLGPRGTSSSPNDSPELRNVVALEVTPKKTPRKENISGLQPKHPKVIEAPSSEKSNDQTDGISVKSLPQQKHNITLATADKEMNQGNREGSSHLQMDGSSFSSAAKSPNFTISNTTDEEVSQENSQPATPSGTFSSKKQKLCGQSDSNPGTPKRTPQANSKIAGNVTPTRTTNNRPTDAVRSSTSMCKDATKNVVVTLVDIDRVLGKSNISVNKQVKVAAHVEDKSQKQTKGNNISASQPAASEPAASEPAASEPAASEPAASTALSNVITASTVILDAPSTSSVSSNIPTTSNASSSIPSQVASTVQQSVPYALPASYTKISDIQLNIMCNLYGVVKFFKPPWKSRGTDMCSVVVLADPSSDEPLECVMFKDVVLLPQIRRVGDIVRLHRMNIKKYKDKLQAVSTRGFSALVFDRNVDIPVTKEAARVTTGTFSFEDSEKKVVQSLKEWRISRSDLFEEAKFLTVSMVEPDLYFDMVCQVKGISKHNNIDCVVLRVTDGTEPQSEIKSCEDNDSYQIVLATDSCPSPLFDVFLYGDHSTLVMNLEVKAGMILLLHNVHSIATQGGPGASLLDVLEPTLELCIHRGSEYGRGLAILPPDADDAQQLLQRIKQQTSVSPKKQS